MDAITVALLGIGGTLVAVVLTYWFSQRSGEQRANHVRDEVIARITALDARLTEVKVDFRSDMQNRFSEVRADGNEHTSQLRSEMSASVARVEARVEGMKEIFSLELKAMKAEILAALPERANRAGGAPPHEE